MVQEEYINMSTLQYQLAFVFRCFRMHNFSFLRLSFFGVFFSLYPILLVEVCSFLSFLVIYV